MITHSSHKANAFGETAYHKRIPRALLTHIYPLPYFDTHTEGLFWFIVFLSFYLPSVFRSRLVVRPEGLELFYWPSERISVRWEEVLEIRRKRVLGMLEYDILILDRPFPTFGIRMVGPGEPQRQRSHRAFVPLSDFVGWPDGALAADLRRFAPRLFPEQTAK